MIKNCVWLMIVYSVEQIHVIECVKFGLTNDCWVCQCKDNCKLKVYLLCQSATKTAAKTCQLAISIASFQVTCIHTFLHKTISVDKPSLPPKLTLVDSNFLTYSYDEYWRSLAGSSFNAASSPSNCCLSFRGSRPSVPRRGTARTRRRASLGAPRERPPCVPRQSVKFSQDPQAGIQCSYMLQINVMYLPAWSHSLWKLYFVISLFAD